MELSPITTIAGVAVPIAIAAVLSKLSAASVPVLSGFGSKLGEILFIHISQILPDIAFSRQYPENLPCHGSTEFVGRSDKLLQLARVLKRELPSSNKMAAAIIGMGGVGKTELAWQYARRYSYLYPGGTCWLQARSADLGAQIVEFAIIALDINEFPEQINSSIAQAQWCWKHWHRRGKVLLIFDDVSDYAAIQPYLPGLNPKFQILMTSRQELGPSFISINLDPLHEKSALHLLNTLAGHELITKQPRLSRDVCQRLGYLPLAIELVGQYLRQCPDRWEEIQESLQESLLNSALSVPMDGNPKQETIWEIFNLSWVELSEEIQELCMFLSAFAAAPIEWDLLEECFPEIEPRQLKDFRDFKLCKFNLLQRISENKYQLHNLVRDFIKKKLAESEENENQIKARVCQVIAERAKQIPERPIREDISQLSSLVAHLSEVSSYLFEWLDDSDLTSPFFGLGYFYQGQGAYETAQEYYEQCQGAILNRFGNLLNLQGIAVLQKLALIYFFRARPEEAKEMLTQAEQIVKQLNIGHEILASDIFTTLSAVYRDTGELDNAMEYGYRALDIRKNFQEEDNLKVAESFMTLATIYYRKDDLQKAEEYSLKSRALREENLPGNHPDIVETLNLTAMIYQKNKRFEEAEREYRKALEKNTKLLGKDHPNVAGIYYNLASLYFDWEKFDIANGYYLRALESFQKKLGENHAWTAQCQERLEKCRLMLPEESKISLFLKLLLWWKSNES
ncbi:tetratricopeptide repeat protein [Synechococcus sp. PCC 7336]|uniref:tetratricopeptide repeat protein n=1 Tax=Synechococcus sp. PCC 7336 TaxID=195250 RepID=UPI00034A95A3|nr:tetratricopeptide repeat protein [Synechococcus sp. PCC 7336]